MRKLERTQATCCALKIMCGGGGVDICFQSRSVYKACEMRKLLDITKYFMNRFNDDPENIAF